MNKEEIQAKLHNYEERLKDVAGEIERLREQLTEAEKLKLRHGDFGYFVDGKARIDIADTMYDKDGRCGNSIDSEFYTIFGNIFDLLKEWSEDLEHYTISPKYGGTIEFHPSLVKHKSIHLCVTTFGTHLTMVEAEEIWHKLGRIIATLKRKYTK